ncbi:hypothetical protein B0H21DRAFT_692425 [Amylocystis lapponica]|nr:hypothetical protein B0H21DRAFT_692425 [Amylocystis lapponica]
MPLPSETNNLCSRGKKRALEERCSDADDSDASSASSSGAPLSSVKKEVVKKSKRADTRICPVCEEAIPVRLLAKHSELETQRVEEIIQQVGSTSVLADAEPDDGLTSRSRRSSLKPRKTFSSSATSTSEVTLEQSERTLRTLKRRRKQRHAKLRELTRDEDGRWWGGRHGGGGEASEGTVCPVCAQMVKGDEDVIEAHVDACLAHTRVLEERERARVGNTRESAGANGDADMDVDVEGEDVRESATNGVSFRGTGFDVRNRMLQDVEDDIDVDGEDEVLFGAPQFTENDILALSNESDPPQSVPSNTTPSDADPIGGEGLQSDEYHHRGQDETRAENKSLNAVVADGKIVRRRAEGTESVKRTVDEVMGVCEAEQVERAVQKARREGDSVGLISALENQVNLMVSSSRDLVSSHASSLLCRICLDPYTEPTVSTGCWHTCCRECWLRCLGSTKMCPICKRITAAADLRRVYL